MVATTGAPSDERLQPPRIAEVRLAGLSREGKAVIDRATIRGRAARGVDRRRAGHRRGNVPRLALRGRRLPADSQGSMIAKHVEETADRIVVAVA